MKFGRNYRMTATGRSGESIEFGYPLTLTFDVTHHIFAAGNHANFGVYNLNRNNRDDLLLDEWFKKRRCPITLNAGYSPPDFVGPVFLPQIFSGNINVAYTERSGSDLITRINALDIGDGSSTSQKPSAYFPSNFSVPANTTFVKMIKSMMALLGGGVQVGEVIVTPPRPIITRTVKSTKSVWDTLQDYTPAGGHVFIDNGVCHMLGQNDTLPGVNNVGTLNTDSGLLNIPKYMGQTVEVSCIFEPALTIGMSIRLDSKFDTRNPNKLYKIVQYTHSGTISGTLSGDAISTITLAALPSTVAPGS